MFAFTGLVDLVSGQVCARTCQKECNWQKSHNKFREAQGLTEFPRWSNSHQLRGLPPKQRSIDVIDLAVASYWKSHKVVDFAAPIPLLVDVTQT
eukprot:5280437-Amphidinium_carterae.1